MQYICCFFLRSNLIFIEVIKTIDFWLKKLHLDLSEMQDPRLLEIADHIFNLPVFPLALATPWVPGDTGTP